MDLQWDSVCDGAGMALMGTPGCFSIGSPAYRFRPEPYEGKGDWSKYLVALSSMPST